MHQWQSLHRGQLLPNALYLQLLVATCFSGYRRIDFLLRFPLFLRTLCLIFLQMAKDWKKSIIGGLFTFTSYAIALWAMTLAPVALVAALRETSIFFGTVFSIFILKERITWIRGLSIALIVAGAIAIKMS